MTLNTNQAHQTSVGAGDAPCSRQRNAHGANQKRLSYDNKQFSEKFNNSSITNKQLSSFGCPAGGGDPEKWWQRTRIHVALLGLAISAVNCYAQATFCIAIVEMVLPADYVVKADAGHTAAIKVRSNGTQVHQRPPELVSLADQSCPVEYKYRDYYDSWRFPSSLNFTSNGSTLPVSASSQIIDVSQRFAWDASQQGILLGAFAIGTAPLQVFGGRLAELYGSKWVLLAGCLGTALTNLTIPHIAHFSYLLLVVNRVLMGVAQAGMEPGLMCLLSEWLTPSETGFFISMLLFAICIGFFLGSLCSSFILALGYGWPLAYYVSGGLNLLVAILWFLYADSWPRHSRYISAEELRFVQSEQGRGQPTSGDQSTGVHKQPIAQLQTTTQPDLISNNHNNNHNNNRPNHNSDEEKNISLANGKPMIEDSDGPRPAPWRNILTTRSVWAFIICKISIRWCADVFGNELPTYLANVLHLSIKFNGILNGVSSALLAIFSFVTGWLVNELLTKQYINIDNKTTLRKIFQSVASFGSALAVFLMTFYDCSMVFSMSMLLVVSCCLVMGTGGELQIPYDMTSRYPGTLHGMACTLSVSGWLAPPLIGVILGDQPSSRYRWSIVWYLTAAINLIGGLAFVLFADASPRDFDNDVRRGGSSKGGSGTNFRPLMSPRASKRKSVTSESTDTQDDDNSSEQTTNSIAGYYNSACKPQDDSPAQTKRDPIPQSGLYFDSKLVRFRQTEASQPKIDCLYPTSADLPLASCDALFPYGDKANRERSANQMPNLSASKFDLSLSTSSSVKAPESSFNCGSRVNGGQIRPEQRATWRRRKRNNRLTRLLSSFAYGNEESEREMRTAEFCGNDPAGGSARQADQCKWSITKEAAAATGAKELRVSSELNSKHSLFGATIDQLMDSKRLCDHSTGELVTVAAAANEWNTDVPLVGPRASNTSGITRTDVRYQSLPFRGNKQSGSSFNTSSMRGAGLCGSEANQLAPLQCHPSTRRRAPANNGGGSTSLVAADQQPLACSAADTSAAVGVQPDARTITHL